MKEYIAETGGRYTYSDDILNLQDLALAMTAIFSECTPFIISGCEVEGGNISTGYVWIGGKIRKFEGATTITLPYYIYERNSHETVVYANDVNKRGRSCYLCGGSSTIPTVPDTVTGIAPAFLTITADAAPRLIDKFFGRYALLINSPSQRQRVDKDVTFLGEVAVEKEVMTYKGVAVKHGTGTALKAKVKDSGEITLGVYLGELLKAEIVVNDSGAFSFMKGETELARIDETGFACNTIRISQIGVGKINISQNHITNTVDNTDEGSISINYTGCSGGVTKFRNFSVYDGKRCSIPIFHISGMKRTAILNGAFIVDSTAPVSVLRNSGFAQTQTNLLAAYYWHDKNDNTIAHVGFVSDVTHDFELKNYLGNVTISPKDSVNIAGNCKLKGVDIYSIFTTSDTYTQGMSDKVDKVENKQLSTEDFTTEYKQKLDSISGSSLEGGGTGYVTASDVAEALNTKLSVSSNLSDVANKTTARTNLDVYSKTEGDVRYLRIANKLLELVNLTADEMNNLTPEQAAALKASKQEEVRKNIDAEKAGTGALKLSKSLNLSDLADKAVARHNISVYSVAEIDEMLSGKLDSDDGYTGVIFTRTLKDKLDGITTGNFAYVDNAGISQSQREGYVLVSDVVQELRKYAPRLLDGYNSSDKDTIASNIGVYTKSISDSRFASVEQLFQDYITYIVKAGKTTAEAQKILRDKLDVLSTADVTNTYLKKDSKLSDLSMPNADARKLACRNIGAAYANDYQPKLPDTGWIQMNNSGSGTDTRNLFIRQIGNIVSIQGVINTAHRDGGNMGGIIAVIPNQIQPPKYGVRCSHADFNDDHRYNRGAWFKIFAGSRTVNIYESGYYNVMTEINFTYFV